MTLPMIRSAEELAELVEELGFLPFFGNDIPGFSLKDCTPKDMWFVEGVRGPWEWREDIAAGGKMVYAKLFRGKAGFVSMKWYPDLVNYRRNGYDFDALYEDGLASRKNKYVMDVMLQLDNVHHALMDINFNMTDAFHVKQEQHVMMEKLFNV